MKPTDYGPELERIITIDLPGRDKQSTGREFKLAMYWTSFFTDSGQWVARIYEREHEGGFSDRTNRFLSLDMELQRECGAEAAMDAAVAELTDEETKLWSKRAAKMAEQEAKAATRQAAIDAYKTDPENADTVEGCRCPECSAVFDYEPEEDPWYACGSCGNEFARSESDWESSRCNQCHKFAARAMPTTCESCRQGIDGYEKVTAIYADGEFIAVA